MLDLSRREILVGTAATTVLSSAMPTALFAEAAAATSAAAAWDLRDIYPTDAAWEAERQSILTAIPRLKAYQGKLGDSAATMKAALAGRVGHQPARVAALHLRLAQGRRGPARRRQPGAQAAGAGRVHRARRGDRLDQS